uniref:THAP domain-containing protein 1 n=1 Tax=Neogobius melanostomus TaxID=47308 RepID=A0A8C6WY87_9GOBI
MPSACCAMGCTNALSQKKGLAFYKFPKDPVRRQKWITAIRRDHRTPTAESKLCSEHFVSGK